MSVIMDYDEIIILVGPASTIMFEDDDDSDSDDDDE